MVTDEILDGHVPLEMVQSSTFEPSEKFTAVLVADVGAITLPVPTGTDQEPVPTDGALPESVVLGDEIHKNCVLPALEAVGRSSTTTPSVAEFEQPPLVMVHTRLLVPTPRLVAALLPRLILVTEPVPAITDQLPVPSVGVLPLRVTLPGTVHTVWLTPTLAVVARLSTTMVTEDASGGHTPLEMVHTKVVAPGVKLTAALVARVGLFTVADPETTDQEPVPTDGVLAFRVMLGEVMQMDCVVPALDRSGAAST